MTTMDRPCLYKGVQWQRNVKEDVDFTESNAPIWWHLVCLLNLTWSIAVEEKERKYRFAFDC